MTSQMSSRSQSAVETSSPSRRQAAWLHSIGLSASNR